MSNSEISKKDCEILRSLARHQIELAKKPEMDILKKKWIEHHSQRNSLPLVTIEIGTFAHEIIPSRLKCEGEYARGIETELYNCFINHDLFEDDTIVKDYFPVVSYHSFLPLGRRYSVIFFHQKL